MSRSVRIMIDATAIPTQRGGVGRYVDQLVAEIARLAPPVIVVSQLRDVSGFAATSPSVEIIPAPAAAARRPVRLMWEQTALPALARRTRASVLLSPHYTTPAWSPVPRVVTFHDATFFSDPNVHLAAKARFFRAATRASLRRMARGVVPSDATRQELVRWAGADARQLEVIPHGVDTEVFQPPAATDVDGFAKRHGLIAGSYIAFLGTLEPRKNLPALVAGWIRAFGNRDDPPDLVLAGAAGWDRRLDAVLSAVPDNLRVIRTGYLPLNDLPCLLGGAAVVAYPSLGEGFGLPVLEAMACGATVLSTRRLSLPEVGGDAVAYTEPSPEAIAEALTELMDSPRRRAQLAVSATERAREFTWKRSAEAHLRVLEEVAR